MKNSRRPDEVVGPQHERVTRLSTVQLLKEIASQGGLLVKKQIALAKTELKVSVRAGGISIGLFAGAAFLGLLAIIMLSVAFAYFIAFTGLDLAWCFLIMFFVYLLIAALLGFIGYKKIQQVKAPEHAIAQGKQIPAAFKRGS